MVKVWRTRLSQDSGFTLIELVAAMTVFALAAGAVLTVLVAGIRTAGFSRDRTLGKDLARQRIEEMRAFPFYQSYGSFPRRVDVLDWYFPNLLTGCPLPGASPSSPGYNTTNKTFTCVVPSLPGHPRFGVTTVTEFIRTNVTGTVETADPNEANPEVGYAWDAGNNDLPPTRFLRVTVMTTWIVGGLPQTFRIESLMGETKLENVLTQGSVTGYMFTATTAFDDGSTLSLEAGPIDTSIYRGNSAVARNDGLVARVRIVDSSGVLQPLTLGSQFLAVAPPDITQAGTTFVDQQDRNWSIWGTVARMGRSDVDQSFARVISTVPAAGGRAILRDRGDGTTVGLASRNSVTPGFNYIDASRDYFRIIQVSGRRPMRVSPSCIESVTPKTVTCESGGTNTDLSSGNTGRLGELRIFPVDYTTLGGVGRPPGDYLIKVEFDHIKVRAKAKALNETSTSAEAQTLFSGQLSWYRFSAATGWVENKVCIRDPVTAGCPAQSPPTQSNSLPAIDSCVVEVTLGVCLVRLNQYISSWSKIDDGIRCLSCGSAPAGTSVEASLNGVLSITTQPTNQTFSNTGYIISIGHLKAQAVDNR